MVFKMPRFKNAALPLLLFLLLLPSGALAEKITALWVTFSVDQPLPSAEKAKPLNAINWWYSEQRRTYYLFLPASAERNSLQIWFTGPSKLTADGRTVSSGDTAGFLVPGEKVTLVSDKNKYVLQVMKSATIPAMFLNTESGTLNDIHKSKSHAETGSMMLLSAGGARLYAGGLSQIKGRGNWTFSLAKRPYQIKLERSSDLCGMGKAKTWILLANHFENSLLRNKIVFDLANAAGLAYSSRSQAVDLYINNDYCGSYLLCEKVQIGDSRIDINDLEKATEKVNDAELNTYPAFGRTYQTGKGKGVKIPNDPKDITGGYLLELEYPDRYKKEASGFITTRGQPVIIKEPEYASPAQVEYIRAFMQGFENAIFSKDGIDPKSGKHYSEFVDMDSLVKKYLIEEITKNFDGNRSSLFYYKPADSQSKLAFCGPVWDYDIALGNYATDRNQKVKNPSYFVTNNDQGEHYYWFPALYKHADFREAVKKAYYESFVPALNVLLGNAPSTKDGLRSLDEYAAEIWASADMNFARRPIFNSSEAYVKTGKDYAENIEYVRNFLKGRMAFLAESWPR